jgi:tRNA dimethylallyltransferase
MASMVVIAGPTGAGKSELAIRIAEARGGEVVNYDSVQVYRGFDIGSAKPSLAERGRVPHHLFDILDAPDDFNAADYGRIARDTCAQIQSRGSIPILAGGTFFYLRALLSTLPVLPGRNDEVRARLQSIAARPSGPHWLHRYLNRIDPISGARIAPGDRHRVERALEVWITSGRPISSWERVTSATEDELPAIKLALRMDRTLLHARIDRRVETMYANGLIEETRALLRLYPESARPFSTIGYKEAVAVIEERCTLAEAIAETSRRTRAYAKRQMTWLRAERNVHWLEVTDPDSTFRDAIRLIEDSA